MSVSEPLHLGMYKVPCPPLIGNDVVAVLVRPRLERRQRYAVQLQRLDVDLEAYFIPIIL